MAGGADRPLVVVSDGPQRTEAIGAELARELTPGTIVLISGEIGAGKTTLVRGAVRALGHEGRVTSPTFTIVNRYEGGRVPVSHLDLYRLGEATLAAEDPALLADELSGERIVFVEWPEAAGREPLGVDGGAVLRVALRHRGGDEREVEVVRPRA